MLEILAPAGGEESLIAALNSGADAVYLGLNTFSARRNATNFTPEELENAVKLCHQSGVKVYVALNTLFFDDEKEAVIEAIRSASKARADAFIVQDLGAAALMKKYAPEMRLHASTQMTITSIAGARTAKEMGFSRVVLARELSLDEITEINHEVDIETEVFVHGALCVSVSGQCYMSSLLGGRSGNRGLCAQPCRLEFSSGRRTNVLSLKDLSVIERLKELENAGVCSAKIEGRMKRPEYVAAAVSACRDALSGVRPDTATLRAVFSRSGFTTGYFDSDYREMSGIRTKEDVVAAATALGALKQLYSKPYKRFTLDFSLRIVDNEAVKCTVIERKSGNTATVTGDIPEKAVNKPLTTDYIAEQMAKLGGTVYECGDVKCELGDGLRLTAAQLNSIRRAALEKLIEN